MFEIIAAVITSLATVFTGMLGLRQDKGNDSVSGVNCGEDDALFSEARHQLAAFELANRIWEYRDQGRAKSIERICLAAVAPIVGVFLFLFLLSAVKAIGEGEGLDAQSLSLADVYLYLPLALLLILAFALLYLRYRRKEEVEEIVKSIMEKSDEEPGALQTAKSTHCDIDGYAITFISLGGASVFASALVCLFADNGSLISAALFALGALLLILTLVKKVH